MKAFLAILLFPIMIFGLPETENHISKTGEKLLNRFWVDLKAANADHVSKYMDPHFQAVHSYGAQDKAGELDIIRNLHITNYVLSSIVETRRGSMKVITYMADVTQRLLMDSL